MNDTFDNFTFSNITTNLEKADPTQKSSDISFDDSLFLNSQDFTILRTTETKTTNTETNSSIFDGFFSSEPFTTTETTPNGAPTGQNNTSCDDLFENSQTTLVDDVNDSPSNTLQSPVHTSENDTSRDLFNANSSLNDTSQEDLFNVPSEPAHMLKLSSWGLPAAILDKYTSRNVTTMFPWQVECLNNPRVLKQHANLVYSAPTSAGKTLVAEILAIKTVLERSKKVIFILPFVSVVREKMFYFQDILSGSGVRVEGFMGSYNPPGGFKSVQFAVCTIEKANSLVNACLQDETLSEIGAVVIDEMHLLGEPHRGYILELLLAKLRYVTLKDPAVDIQIIGMSATLPNLRTLSKWLDAELYTTTFRPIPLYEQASIAGAVYDSNFALRRTIAPLPDLETDTDNVLQLCLETVTEGRSVLIFCPTKSWCENLARQIATAFWKLGGGGGRLGQDLRRQLDADLIAEVLEQLRRCPAGLDAVLRKTVSYGAAFHHAGLTLDERDIVEGAFRSGVVRVLVATSTLSSGVNLPARRVIIRTPVFHGKPLDALTYRQMIGRAGRTGKDTCGESVLVCQKHEEKIARGLMVAALTPIESCLEEARLKRAVLEIVASGVASTVADVETFTRCTLRGVVDPAALDFLVDNELLRVDADEYVATPLGKACLSASMPPDDGLSLFVELQKARQCFVLESELHLVYLVTPYSACHQWGNLDWMFYLSLWEKLPAAMKKVGELVGVRESYIVGATRGKLQTNTPELYRRHLVHKRFFVALALQDLVNERPLAEVCARFGCNRGLLQTLQLTAATFAGMVTAFSRQLGWSTVEILVAQFQDRLHFGVGRDLLDLMRLPILNGKCARALFDAGLEGLVQVANSDVDTIERALRAVAPFESEKRRDGETDAAARERTRLRNIWIAGKEGLTEREAARLLLTAAREHLRKELGLKEAQWGTNEPHEDDTSLLEKSVTCLNSSGDVVTTSQDESFLTPARPLKRGRRARVHVDESPRKRTRLVDSSHRSPGTRTRPPDMSHIEVVDVCADESLFAAFRRESESHSVFSVAIGCSGVERRRTIGLTPNAPDGAFVHKDRKVEGVAVSWDGRTAYYVRLDANEASVACVGSLVHKGATVRMFDSKEQIKVLKRCCGVDCRARVEDPKVADWLLQPDGREKTLVAMVGAYCPSLAKVAQLCGITKTGGSPALCVQSTVDAKVRACAEALLAFRLVEALADELARIPGLVRAYDAELSCLRVLARMELVGVPAHKPTLANLARSLRLQQQNVESRAFALAGRRFNPSSSREVAKVLGLVGRRVSTRKQVLERSEQPVAALVRQWRTINCSLTKLVLPLLGAAEGGRIHGCSVVHTATGRITMHEPNLQNVTKNFEVEGAAISCRDAVVAGEGRVLVSADYCQLELRLLAHLSGDEGLCGVMRGEGDVFRAVAAKWSKVEEREVTDAQRQHVKQICYGIIYGMGSKALGEQLGVDEAEATIFMDTFRNAYPGVKRYVQDVVEGCRSDGYVTTLGGRRRYLPHINHPNAVIRGQAERQAVNSTIQGSAADIVKRTMVVVDGRCSGAAGRPQLVLHLHDELMFEVDRAGLRGFAAMLKTTMEESVQLSIPFPVKVKVGRSWGQLAEYK